MLYNGEEGNSDENRAAELSPEGVERKTMSDLAVRLATILLYQLLLCVLQRAVGGLWATALTVLWME